MIVIASVYFIALCFNICAEFFFSPKKMIDFLLSYALHQCRKAIEIGEGGGANPLIHQKSLSQFFKQFN